MSNSQARNTLEPEFALTASGRSIELPKAAAGNCMVNAGRTAAANEAQAFIQRGDLPEALIWLERAGFDGLAALVKRGA